MVVGQFEFEDFAQLKAARYDSSMLPTRKRIWPYTWMESPYFIPLYMDLLWFVNAISLWNRSRVSAIALIVCIGTSVPWVWSARRGRSWHFWILTAVYLVSLLLGVAGTMWQSIVDLSK